MFMCGQAAGLDDGRYRECDGFDGMGYGEPGNLNHCILPKKSVYCQKHFFDVQSIKMIVK
jgi:hypothetical protein